MKIYLVFACLAVWCLNIFDYASTTILLNNNGFEELNPILNYMIGIFGVENGILLVKIPCLIFLTLLTFIMIKKTPRRQRIILSFSYTLIIVVYSYCMYQFNWQGLRMI